MQATLPRIICSAAIDLCQRYAVTSNDGFRQFVYQELPESYIVNSDLQGEVYDLMLKGYCAQDIFEKVKIAHA